MITSSKIRQSFLDFFKSKQHTIVPSSSLMPDSPNLLFTNAGMNQFVPIFLGQAQCPYTPGRAADTQKCIRAGGKHNDLDDVGLDTYHHTFFEMFGNWSFGDYFKKEAIEWAWELIHKVWQFPAQRLYATVFCPYLGEPGWERKWAIELEQVIALSMTSTEFIPPNPDASPFEIADQEAAMYWVKKFTAAGCDPKNHIIPGNKKDNFWMMGETGPCGPCSELHVDLTPEGKTKGKLVNQGDARCIEIWNLVFIQFNANPDGTYATLPARHVDTGMGFERVTSIIQGTKGLKDFTDAKISNYETDIFRPIFDAIEKLSGRKYGSTLPKAGSAGDNEQEKNDVAFRVIADHIRTLSFAIADGIQPGNTDRNYVLRRILRRAVRYGRALGFHEPFLYRLVDVLAESIGEVFPEIVATKDHVQQIIMTEEEAFNKTLDKGITLFESALITRQYLRSKVTDFIEVIESLEKALNGLPDAYSIAGNRLLELEPDLQKLTSLLSGFPSNNMVPAALNIFAFSTVVQVFVNLPHTSKPEENYLEWLKKYQDPLSKVKATIDGVRSHKEDVFSGTEAFVLYDTYGFPLDLTELMARERGLTVDVDGFNKLMEEQRNRARKAQKKTVIELSQFDTNAPTKFLGYDYLETEAVVESVSPGKKSNEFNVVLDRTACYAEMGGQVGDAGVIHVPGHDRSEVGRLQVLDTLKQGPVYIHRAVLADGRAPESGEAVRVAVDVGRRNAIQRHHTVTHLLHWALHEVVSKEATQKGSFVGPDKLTFDFNNAPLMPEQVSDIEKLVNERILENAGVSWTEVPYADVKPRKDVMQFFGDKYGDTVRVVQIGGGAGLLNGYSMELCGGTHTRATGEIGLFRILGESAIAAGVRRIEAVAGLTAFDAMKLDRELIKNIAGKVNSPVHELEKKMETLLAQQKELEKQLKAAQQREAANAGNELLGCVQTVNEIPSIVRNLGGVDGNFLQTVADSLKGRFKGVIVLGGVANGAVSLVAAVSPEFTAKIQAGKIIQTIAPLVGGKGGGRPDNARGGGKDAAKLDEALAKVATMLK